VDVITLSDIRDVRDCGDVSEEEPGFIPNSFVIEEVHRYCWSIFTDTQDAMVCLCPIPISARPDHDAFTGENNGRVNILFGCPQGRPFPTSLKQHSIRVSHSTPIPGSLYLIVLPMLLTPYPDGPSSHVVTG